MKDAIPDVFNTPLNRLKLIKSGHLTRTEMFNHSTKNDCDAFLLAAANPEFKNMAMIAARQMAALLSDINSLNRKQIFKGIIDGSDFDFLDGVQPANEKDLGSWRHQIKGELEEYLLLLRQFNIDVHKGPVETISTGTAKAICKIKVGGKFFIQQDNHADFVRFYTNVDLDESERRKMKIKIGTTRPIAAHIIHELVNRDICPDFIALIDEYKIFFSNRGACLIGDSLSSDNSKFKGESYADAYAKKIYDSLTEIKEYID